MDSFTNSSISWFSIPIKKKPNSMFRWWSSQTMAGHKVNHLPKTWGDWWNLTVGPGHRDRQDVIVSYAPVQVTAPRKKKGQGSGNMWTLRRTAKVLNLSHFSWLDSSQAEGKGLCQPTFPKLMYQQNGLSLSPFLDPKQRISGHHTVLLGVQQAKAKKGYLTI